MIRETIAGNVIERSKFKLRTDKKRASRKKGNTSPRKQDRNGRQALRQLQRTINANFNRGDFFLTFKYDSAGMENVHSDPKEAEHQVKLCIQRLARAYKKLGLIFKWIEQTSFIDGDTGEVVRIHHHVLVSGSGFTYQGNGNWTIAGKPLNDYWGFGTVDWQPIHNEVDHGGIAVYMYRQAHTEFNQKRWTCSRNMTKPIIHEYLLSSDTAKKRMLKPDGRIKIPKRAEDVECNPYDEMLGTDYVRYTLPQAEKKREKGEDINEYAEI